MRWDGQQVEADERGRLPGLGDTVVRTFDAPEALDTRFHEVRAKSVLNRVPGGSRVPFNWTVNPYRGCSHACTYTQSGRTPILMGDGSITELAHLRPGETIYGTRFDGKYRRYVRTQVLDHWSVIKPAFRTTLADGTELVSSGSHRFLTERGWKHVTGAMSGPEQRPYLTLNNSLMGFGTLGPGPLKDDDYRRGYLCGMVRGDALLASYRCASGQVTHQFRLALVDREALDRTEQYLSYLGIRVHACAFSAGTTTRKPIDQIRTGARSSVDAIRDQIRWPLSPSDSWRHGFLAGIFDAEGGCSRGVMRICNSDPMILDWTKACLRRFGFDAVIEPPLANGCRTVLVRGGLKERMRFFRLTDPAIMRKRDIEGMAIKSTADLRVVSIEPVGTLRLYDITTGTGDYISDGVVSHNCFARPTHEYLDLNAGRDFEKEIIVKVNAPEVLRAQLAKPSWTREHVALGTNTDPYQWVEGRYKLMRGIWEAFIDAVNPCSVLTKSPLLLRDADLMKRLVERTDFSAALSVPTLEEKAWRATEPHTPHPRARLEAVAELNRQGIPTGILIAPLIPGVNDDPKQVERIIELATEAGATSIGGQALFLHGAVRKIFFEWLETQRPDLLPLYRRLYARGSRIPRPERDRIEAPVRRARLQSPYAAARFRRPASDGEGPPSERVETPRTVQTTLF